MRLLQLYFTPDAAVPVGHFFLQLVLFEYQHFEHGVNVILQGTSVLRLLLVLRLADYILHVLLALAGLHEVPLLHRYLVLLLQVGYVHLGLDAAYALIAEHFFILKILLAGQPFHRLVVADSVIVQPPELLAVFGALRLENKLQHLRGNGPAFAEQRDHFGLHGRVLLNRFSLGEVPQYGELRVHLAQIALVYLGHLRAESGHVGLDVVALELAVSDPRDDLDFSFLPQHLLLLHFFEQLPRLGVVVRYSLLDVLQDVHLRKEHVVLPRKVAARQKVQVPNFELRLMPLAHRPILQLNNKNYLHRKLNSR